ncbi:MAG: S8 family peptidase [Bacteroidales bacterium]|nr:S8 family peptidase [Bacteroidales bacterium]
MRNSNQKFVLILLLTYSVSVIGNSQSHDAQANEPKPAYYLCEDDLIEIMFVESSRVRLRNGLTTDLTSDAMNGVDAVLSTLFWFEWQRFSEVDEDLIDKWAEDGERNTGQKLYNLNNIFRLQIPKGNDIWELSTKLEALPGIFSARPVPKPMALPLPGNYQSLQGYLKQASIIPSGLDANYAWTVPGGTGSGITICNLEYSWNYNHADITKAVGSQINTNVVDPFSDNNHGTAVIGMLVADNNGWGTTGICFGANLLTCGTNYGSPTATWNVPGAIAVAIANLSAGDIILLEQQWDYTGTGGFVPIEWWLNYSPNPQTNNGVYSAIQTAVANGIHVVQAGGNGEVNTGMLNWYGNSGAIIVGAGTASSGNDLQRITTAYSGSWGTSYGQRFDLQGWGENVMTTGYGTYYSAQGPNYYYRADFRGTSSAAPCVAGAIACVQGYYVANISGTPMLPINMRNLLVSFGTPQVFGPSGNIGPRPDLFLAITNIPPPSNDLDFGDAPDPPYPTLISSSGASHIIDGVTFLGYSVDPETDGQPNATATGDDNDGNNDDDGVIFTSVLMPGQNANLQVIASVPGVLNAWIDFNHMNVWGDPGEFIFQNVILAAGVNNLSFAVPPNGVPGNTFARFRFNTTGGLLFYDGYGPAPDGEVEDYEVFIEEPMSDPYDFGDAPEGTLAYPASGVLGQFPTCINVGLPNSWIQHSNFGAFFGPSVDLEPEGNAGLCPMFNPNTYNQDECFQDGDAGLLTPGAFTIVGSPGAETVVTCPGSNGMTLGPVCTQAIWGQNIDIQVQNFMPNMTGGLVNVIIDWDQNGIWGGVSSCPGGVNVPEHVLINFPVPNGFNGPLSMLMPPGFLIGPNAGYVWARFSITEIPVLLPWDGSGVFEDGETEDYLLLLDAPPPPDFDFGDAPDPTYPTLAASNGASHGNNPPGYFMGALIDYEPDGQSTPNASGDDTNNLQDEDGLSYTSPATVGQSYNWLVQASMLGGFINIWVDFNCDGDWADAGEHVVIDAVSTNLTMGFSILIPANATPGNTFVRVRFSSVQGLSNNGFAPSGEVEDYMLTIAGLPQYDFGDAPDQPWNNYFYPTLLASNGARHLIVSGVHLGNLIDAEVEGLTNINSLGDDQNNLADEDGALTNWHSYMSVGYPMNMKVNASTSGLLDAWMDFNKDGDWNDAGEQIFTSVPLSPGDNYVSFIIPRNANTGFTPFPYSSRYRFSTAGGLSYTGQANDGEVEDYAISFNLNTLYQWSQPHKQTYSNWSGIHCHDAVVSGQLQILVNADDFISYEGNVSGIVWYGCYEIPGLGINRFHLSLHNSNPGCLPADPEIWGADVLLGSVNETATGNYNSMGEMIYRYEYYLPTPVQLQAGSTYWLDISARCNNPNVPARWKWMESSRSRVTALCPAVQRVIVVGVPSVWSPLYWASNNTHSEMAFEIMSAMDFGDAPLPYPTTLANNGACHSNWWGPLHLGNVIDYESDGLPDPNALGDDNNNLQDEDGIVFLSPLYIGQNVAIQVTVTGSGLLQGWVDFNRNGSWSDPGEQIMLNLPVSTGTFIHNFIVPPNAVAGPSFARFRLSTWTLPANIFDGYLPSGEVEDYIVEIIDAFFDFGDAPEGALAYPASGVIGQFPTCMNVGPPGSFIQHNNFGAFFGPSVDFELEGNAGLCPNFNPNMYNQDECFNDGDAGLLHPGAFTIVGPPGAEVIVACPGIPFMPLGNICTLASWGGNIDIQLQNFMPNNTVGYVNVLFDWDHNGIWSGFATCTGGQQVPEHALVNHLIPNGFSGQLSATSPPPFTIGPASGYVWVRISITEQPVPANWDGSGIFEDGETEDYMFHVLPDPNINLQNITVPGGQTTCYEAAQTITTAGSGTTFIVQNGAVVYLVAGQNIIMKDGTHFKNGSYVHVYIEQDGEYCSNPKAIVFEQEPLPKPLPFEIAEKDSFFKVYPNPNTGQFTLELSERSEFSTIKVEIFNLVGERIMDVELLAMKQYLFDLSAKQPGIYLVRVMQGNDVGIEKVIKQ